MKKLLYLFVFTILSMQAFGQHVKSKGQKFAIVIHGGAGTIKKEYMSDEMEAEYRAKLAEALETGYKVLENGGTSMDAIQQTINVLENSPLFNAGKGAVLNSEGYAELDASIMDGKTRNAGAVAGVRTLKNPIDAARLVMEKSPHVMLSGTGADQYAAENGLTTVKPDYFITERRKASWQKIRDKEEEAKRDGSLKKNEYDKHGTVGAVAIDQYGNIAAGTSTGGMTYKRFGRIGDSPVIGAGTYANNVTCGVSSTGHGEYFIRAVVAYDISALMQYKGLSLEEATETVINKKLTEMGGTGGVISLDHEGNISMTFNTAGMYRGYMNEAGKPMVFIYGMD